MCGVEANMNADRYVVEFRLEFEPTGYGVKDTQSGYVVCLERDEEDARELARWFSGDENWQRGE